MIDAIFQYEFLQNAFFTGMIIGIIAPLIGVFVVVRRLSLIADALSHVTLAGIAASLLLEKKFLPAGSLNPIYIGMVFSVVGSLFIEKLRTVYRHYQELAIPIILIKWNWVECHFYFSCRWFQYGSIWIFIWKRLCSESNGFLDGPNHQYLCYCYYISFL